MNNYLDDYMYYNGGINPFHMYEIYGRGGLGYKPHDYRMTGGMAFRDIKNPNKILYEKYNDKDDKIEDVEIPQLITLKNDLDEQEFKNRLMNEAKELVDLYKDSLYEGNKILKQNVINDYKIISKELTNYNLSQEEIDRMMDYKNEIKNLKDSNKTDIINDAKNNENDNVFYNKMEILAENEANKVYNDYLNGTKEERNKIQLKYITSLEDEQRFNNLNSINEKADYLKNKAVIFEKGNKSEDKLIDKDILLTFLDKDDSPIFNTKDEKAYNPSFINDLKKIGLNTDQIKSQVLEKMNIDAIKDNTLWELKAFNKNSYDANYKREDYSKAKFFGSKPFIISVDKPNSTWIDLYEVYYTINKIPNTDKIDNINYFIKKKYGVKQYKGEVLKPNTQGYNYYILENNRDRIQYINPLGKDNWNMIETHFTQNPNKNYTNIPNLNFIKYPKDYINRFEEIRLKKNIRSDKKNMYKEWIKSKNK